MDQDTLKFKPSSPANNVKINRAPDGAMAKLLAAILTGARILTAEAMWNTLAICQDYGNFQQEITGYILAKEAGCLYLKNVL